MQLTTHRTTKIRNFSFVFSFRFSFFIARRTRCCFSIERVSGFSTQLFLSVRQVFATIELWRIDRIASEMKVFRVFCAPQNGPNENDYHREFTVVFDMLRTNENNKKSRSQWVWRSNWLSRHLINSLKSEKFLSFLFGWRACDFIETATRFHSFRTTDLFDWGNRLSFVCFLFSLLSTDRRQWPKTNVDAMPEMNDRMMWKVFNWMRMKTDCSHFLKSNNNKWDDAHCNGPNESPFCLGQNATEKILSFKRRANINQSNRPKNSVKISDAKTKHDNEILCCVKANICAREAKQKFELECAMIHFGTPVLSPMNDDDGDRSLSEKMKTFSKH